MSDIWDELVKKEPEREEPKRESEPKVEMPQHHMDSFIGHCTECGVIETEKLEKLMEIGGISETLRAEYSGWEYVCEMCGSPVAKTREDAKKLAGCWYCGHKRATRREKFRAT